jgi:pentatricopeptide repeat domain-containing protein 2
MFDFSNICCVFQAFRDPELEDFFAQLVTYQILMDLLFQNERYQDMLDVFEIIKQRQHQEGKFPKNVVILTFAACFKLVSTFSSMLFVLLYRVCLHF